MHKILAGIVLVVVIGVGIALVIANQKTGAETTVKEEIVKNITNNMEIKNPQTALIETSLGNIKVQFYGSDAPKTVENFAKLAGQKYYDGLTFHRVIPDFMVQGGDPNCTPARSSGSCGSGGPGYKFEDELDPSTASAKTGYKKGVLAMANAGPNTNGSQFFIMVADVPLQYNYTIFGKVLEGQDVADKISLTQRDGGDRPLTPVVIKKVTVQ